MSHVAGKNMKELQAMAKGRVVEEKKGPHYFALIGWCHSWVAIFLILKLNVAAEQKMKEEYPFSPPKVKYVSCPSQTLLYSDTPTLFFSFLISYPIFLQS